MGTDIAIHRQIATPHYKTKLIGQGVNNRTAGRWATPKRDAIRLDFVARKQRCGLAQHMIQYVVEELAGQAVYPVCRVTQYRQAVVACQVIAIRGINMYQLPKGATVEQFVELQIRGFIVVEVVDSHQSAGPGRFVIDTLRVLCIESKGLLKEHVTAGAKRHACQSPV